MNSIATPPEASLFGRKTSSLLHLGAVDIGALRDDVLAIPEDMWQRENATKPNRFVEFDTTTHIVFRFVNSFNDWRFSHDRPLWPAWKDRLLPLMEKVVARYGYARGMYPRVMLARLAPGGVISEHTDNGPAARGPHKIHVPLLTNPGVQFYIEPNTYHLEAGQAYEVNNLVRHAVRNDGETPRIHLIFEYCEA